MSLPPTAHLCAGCDEEALLPALVCLECSEGVNVDGSDAFVSYCSMACRDAHRADHQIDCDKRNARKHIYRAGDLMQSAFYHSRDCNYAIKITRLEKKEGILYYRNAGYPAGNNLFQTSPYKLTDDKEDAHALMSHLQCDQVLARFYKLSKKLLEGMD